MPSKIILSVKKRRASTSSSSLCPNKRIKTDDGKKEETTQRKIMTKSFGNRVKKQEKIPLHIKTENVPEESTAPSDDESPIATVLDDLMESGSSTTGTDPTDEIREQPVAEQNPVDQKELCSRTIQTTYDLVKRRHAKIQTNIELPHPPPVKMVTVSTQTEQTCIEHELNTSFLSVDDNHNDPDWSPDNEIRDEPSQECQDINPSKERKFIVFESCLDQLFQSCQKCGSPCSVTKHLVATYVQINSLCDNCCNTRKWESQPKTNTMPLGNLIMAGAVLFSGSSASKFITLCRHASLQMFSIGTYMNIQSLYLVPTIEDVWQCQQCDLFSTARATGEPLRLGGDGRCCSPGHTAKYLSYTLMDLRTNKILDTQLVQGISNYEQLRLKNLQDNADFFTNLGVAELRSYMKDSIRRLKRSTTHLKPKPVMKDKRKAPPEPRRISLRIAKMDPASVPLPEDLLKMSSEPVEEHRRNPTGPLEMKSYLGFESEETEHEDLMSKLKSCFKCKAEKTTGSNNTSLDSCIKTFSKMKINTDRVAKVVPYRILSLDIHPSNNKLITAAGDQWGFLGIWDVVPGREHQSDGVVVYMPHSRPINCLRFSPYKYNQLYSCSYDGTLRCCDLEKAIFDEVYSTTDDKNLLLKNFDFLTADTMLVSQQDGTVAVVDTRTSNSTAENEYLLHNKSLRTISVHPVQNNIFCTSSTDCFDSWSSADKFNRFVISIGHFTVCIWDLRKLNKKTKNRPMDEINHGKSVSSAYFSPVTGNYILSTSMDDKISIFNCEKLSSVERQHSISHDNHARRWISQFTQFRATWHPKREDMFVVGSMARPRMIEMYGSNGRKVLELKDEEILGSVCSLNVIGSSQDVVVGANSSGRLHVFM